jgi:hypothetical protein
LKFFFDNNLPPHLAAAISALSKPEGHAVVHLRDKFDPSVRDVDWIRALAAEKDWVIVSGDYQISRKEHEKQAWRESGLTAFFLVKGWTNFSFWDQSYRLVRWWPRIIEQARLVQAGAGFEVPINATSKFKQIVFR